MISEKRAKILVALCLNELYEHSMPPVSWSWIRFFCSNTDIKFWELHKITEKRYNEIVKKYKKKLGPLYSRSLNWDLLNYAPVIDNGKN
jgi:hypothetical protein